MKVFRDFLKGVLAVSLALIGALGYTAGALAAEDEQPAYRIQVSPARMELDLEPGEKVSKKFKIQNTGTEDFGFELSTGPFSVTDENYTQDLNSVTKYNDMKDWITFSEDEGTVEAGKSVEVTATVTVPNDVPSGGQYAVILAKMIEPVDKNTSGIIPEKQVGMLIYAKNIDGNTRREGGVLENQVPSFMFVPPIKATSLVENTGNVHEKAEYVLQVFPLFGSEEVYTNEENPLTLTILPETRRLNTVTWEGSPKLGIFKVKQTVKFLGQDNVTEKIVFICPIWFLLIILVLIFLIVFWIVSRVRGRKE